MMPPKPAWFTQAIVTDSGSRMQGMTEDKAMCLFKELPQRYALFWYVAAI